MKGLSKEIKEIEAYSFDQLEVIESQAKTSRLDEWLSDHPKLLKVLIAGLEVLVTITFFNRGWKLAFTLLLVAVKALQERNSLT